MKKNRIHPRHIQLAVKNDEELNRFLGRSPKQFRKINRTIVNSFRFLHFFFQHLLVSATIAAGGVLPNVQQALVKKSKGGASQEF